MLLTVPGSHAAADADLALLRAAHPVTFPAVQALLGGRPARRVPGLGVLVADPVLVRDVLTDTGFRKDGPGSSGALWAGVLGHRTLIGMDGRPHRTLRRALSPVFTPAMAHAACAAALTEPLAAVTRALAAGEEVDVITVAREAAVAVIAQLVGMPAQPELAAAGEQILAMIGLGTRRLSPRQVRRVQTLLGPVRTAALAAYDGAASQWHGGAGAPPGAGCVMNRLPAVGISRDQAPSLAAVLLLTGTETVVSAAPRAVAMMTDAGLVPRLAGLDETERAHTVDQLVTEAIRLATPSPGMLRRATIGRDLGPVRVRAGDRVLLLTWWATRLPGGLCPGRDPGATRGLAFGAGAHQCLGQALAVAEVRAVVQAVLDGVSPGQTLQVQHRAPACRVFVPSYRRLVVRSIDDGPPSTRPAHDGSAPDGLAHYGSAQDGLAHDGSAHDGSAPDGSAHDGSGQGWPP